MVTTYFEETKFSGYIAVPPHPFNFIHKTPCPKICFMALSGLSHVPVACFCSMVFDLPAKPLVIARAIEGLVFGMMDLGFTYYAQGADLGNLEYLYHFRVIAVNIGMIALLKQQMNLTTGASIFLAIPTYVRAAAIFKRCIS